MAVPDRTHLVGRRVRVKLNWWRITGPRRGIFLGQGERGLSLQVKGGGRFVYMHEDVKSVQLR